MTDIKRELVEALIERINKAHDENQAHEDGDVAYEFRQLVISKEYRVIKAALKPSKKEVVSKLVAILSNCHIDDSEQNFVADEYISQAIDYLRGDDDV